MPSNFPPQQNLRPLNLISSSDEAMLHPRRTKSGYARLPAELDLDNYEPKGISGQNFLIRGYLCLFHSGTTYNTNWNRTTGPIHPTAKLDSHFLDGLLL
jgi:hypothetical protein